MSDLVIRFSDEDIVRSRTECLFECNVQIHRHFDQLAHKLCGRTVTVGSFRGTVQSCENGTATLKNETSGAESRVPISRALHALHPLEGDTRR